MKNRQYSQFALLAMANRKHNEHRHIRSAIRELLAAELDLKNDGNGTGVGHLTVLDRIHEALAELRWIGEQMQLGNTAIAGCPTFRGFRNVGFHYPIRTRGKIRS